VIVVDANVVIRALVGTMAPTDEPLVASARGLFLAVAEGREAITTNEAVIAEVAFILHDRRHYGVPRRDVVERFVPLLDQSGCHVGDEERVLVAFDLWLEHPRISFADALTASQALWLDQPLATFDAARAALPGVVRWPADQAGSGAPPAKDRAPPCNTTRSSRP